MAYRIINKFDQSYSPDDLVLIEKGALLKKDNEDTKYLQLKLKNNSKEILSKVSITILLFDESGHQLDAQTYEYKDMFVPGGENFGIKTAIPLNREDVCSVKVLIENNLQYVGSKADKEHKKPLMERDDFLHCIILCVIVTTLFLQISKREFELYSMYGTQFLEVGFAALITYPIISLMLCSKSEYKKNMIWLFMSLIGLTTQVLLRIAVHDYYTIATIDIISNIVIFGFAIILILQSKSKDYLMIIVPYGFSCLYLALTNILIRNSNNSDYYLAVYQYSKVLLFILSIITIFVICYILRKLKHNKILTGIFLAFSIMAVIFSKMYSQEIFSYAGYDCELYPNLLYNFIQYEMIGFSFVLILEWFKDKYLIRKRSR